MMKKSLKILLVYPPITSWERYGSELAVFGGHQIPLGIYYLASYVRQHGYPVYAIDAEALHLSNDEIVRRIREEGFNVLGISSTTVAFHRSLELAKSVKKELPHVLTVVGGPHVSSQPHHPMQFEEFDFAIQNEGEKTLVELLDCLEEKKDLSSVLGLIRRENGDVAIQPQRPYIDDLDSMPFPAFDMIPDLNLYTPPPFNYKKSPVANIITSRGCPNECTFCENSTFGRKFRMRSADNIVDEIEQLVNERGVKEFAFVDDTFTVRPQRIYEIFEKTASRGLKFPWTCMSRINTVDEELLRFMRDNGCWYISFGIESGDEEILRTIKKRIRLDAVKRVVSQCRKLGITTKGFFMVGHPRETWETIDKTIRFAKSLPLDHVTVTINTPMPGSEQYRLVKEYGTIDNQNWNVFNYWNPVFVPNGLTREGLLKKHKEFLRRFYLRPSVLFRQFKIAMQSPQARRHLMRIGRAMVSFFFTQGKRQKTP